MSVKSEPLQVSNASTLITINQINNIKKDKFDIAKAYYLGYKVRKIMRSKIALALRSEYIRNDLIKSKVKLIELVNMLMG